MTEFSTKNAYDPILSSEHNALLDHGLEKAASYIIRLNGSDCEAIKGGSTSGAGTIAYGGSSDTGGVDGADSAAVIQACLDALTSGGLILIKDDLTIGTKISYAADHTTIMGQAVQAPTITLDANVNDDMFLSDTKDYCGMFNLKLAGAAASQTAGSCFKISGGYDNVIRDCFFYNAKEYGLEVAGTHTGLSCWDTYMEYNVKAGLYIRSAQDYFYNCDFYGNSENGVEGYMPYDYPPTVMTTGLENHFVSCRVEGNAQNGVYLAEETNNKAAAHYIFTGCAIVANGYHGVLLEGAKGNIFSNCKIRSNSQDTDNTYDGFHFKSSTTHHSIHNIITGCIIVDDGWAKNQRYGVRENDANQNRNIVHGCIVLDNQTGQVSQQGAQSVAADNIVA